MAEIKDKKRRNYSTLLNNLRILGCVEPGEYVGTIEAEDDRKGYDLYCRYSSNWWNTLSDIVRLETWKCTHECLKSIYCLELNRYLNELDKEDDEYKIRDLKRVCENSVVGLKHLKNTYNIAYQTKEGGKYDEKFDTIIESYANIYIKLLDDMLDSYSSSECEDDDVTSDMDINENIIDKKE